MQVSDQPGARRPTAVAALAAVLLLSVVSAVTASARPTSVSALRMRRASAALFDSQASGSARRAQPRGAQGADDARPPPRESGRRDRRPTDGHAPDGRASRRVPHRSEQPAGIAGGDGLRASAPAGVRTQPRRPADVPSAAGLRRHRGHPSRLVDAERRRDDGVPRRAEGERHGRRPVDQRHRPARPRSSDRRVASAPRLDRRDRCGSASCRSRRPRGAADDTATLVLFPTQRGARIAWQTTTWVDPNFLALSVVDAQTGDVLWRANLTQADAVGTGQAVDMYPSGDLPNGGGDVHPVTFPVFDGTALSGNNAHVYADVNDDDKVAPKDEVPALSGTDWSGYMPEFNTTDASQNCSIHFYCAWDKTVAPRLEPEPELVRRPTVPLPQHVPRSPPGRPDRVHGGGGELPGVERDGAGPGRRPRRRAVHRRRQHRERLPRRRPHQQRELLDAARWSARDHADVPAARGTVRAAHPVGRLRERGRDRLSRVHARTLQPIGHDTRRHPGPELGTGGIDGRGVERLVRDRLHGRQRLVL